MRIQLGLIMAALLLAVEAVHATDKPNIIFIMADDLGYGDLGCYGQKVIQTPQIDRLAAEGIRFTQAYASSVCAPTRGILMTGLHGGHAPVRDNIPHYDSYLQDGDVTLAERLKQAGYRTGGVGKWSLGDAGTSGRATRQGFDMWLGYLNQDHAHYYYPEYLDDGEGRLELSGNTESRKHYSHDLMTRRALDFIRASKDESFFFYGAYTVPHFAARSEDQTRLPIPSDAPYSEREWTQTAKNYAAMVTMLDRDVGKIVALVDELGLREKTLIIFTSDNGPWGLLPKKFRSAGPLRGVKRDLYEGGIRVPFVARWPGQIPAGRTSQEIVAFWDILPTFVELAGADAPTRTDGVSIVSALKGGAVTKPHTYLYWDYGHCRSRYDQAVRLGNWKGLRLGRENAIELYDLSQDVGEAHNVAAAQPEIVRQIEQIMATAATPSPRYPIGKIYKGAKKWKPAARKSS
jgi:arylsulfatase A-like enzyme